MGSCGFQVSPLAPRLQGLNSTIYATAFRLFLRGPCISHAGLLEVGSVGTIFIVKKSFATTLVTVLCDFKTFQMDLDTITGPCDI